MGRKNVPIFTTKDGVGIKKDDNYYRVDEDDFEISFCKANGGEPYNDLKFSTEKAAKEYVINNKPVLTLSEVNHFLNDEQRNHLVKIIKNKLNQETNAEFS